MRTAKKGNRKIKQNPKTRNQWRLISVLIVLCLALVGVFVLKKSLSRNQNIRNIINDDELQYKISEPGSKTQRAKKKVNVQDYQKKDRDYLDAILKETFQR